LRRSVWLASITSATGYAVLAVSGLSAVREFGLLLAGSVLVALASAWCVVWATVRRQPRQFVAEAMEKTPEKTVVGVHR